MRGIFGIYSGRTATAYCMHFKAQSLSFSSRCYNFIGKQFFSTAPGPESPRVRIRTTDVSSMHSSLEKDFRSHSEEAKSLLVLIQTKTDASKTEAEQILELKGDVFLKHSIKDMTAIIEIFEKELSMTPKQLKIVFQLGRKRLQQSADLLADTIQLLKEEYHLSKDIVRNITSTSKSCTSILNSAILRDCAERKLIFESIYGEGCFDRVQHVRYSVSHQPSLLRIPPSLLYYRINWFMQFFGCSHPRELNWMQATTFVYSDLDYLERKTKLFYRYLTGGLELAAPTNNLERKRFVIPKEEYENHQKELEKRKKKYPFLLEEANRVTKKLALDDKEENYDKEEEYDEKLSRKWMKMKKARHKKNIVEDESLYESYRQYRKGEEAREAGERMDESLQEEEDKKKSNRYEDFVMKTILDYEQKNKLDVMKEIDPLFMDEIEAKLQREAQLPMKAFYRELWKLSEQRDEETHFSHEKALECIEHLGLTNRSFCYLLSKMGMLAIYSNHHKPQLLLTKKDYLQFSLEENIYPKLVVLGKAIPTHFKKKQEKELLEEPEKEEVKPTTTAVQNAKTEQPQQQPPQQSLKTPNEVLQECVHSYCSHPVRVKLTHYFSIVSKFTLVDIERAMELFGELPFEEQERNMSFLKKFIVLSRANKLQLSYNQMKKKKM
jgi:hypothetical protein